MSRRGGVSETPIRELENLLCGTHDVIVDNLVAPLQISFELLHVAVLLDSQIR